MVSNGVVVWSRNGYCNDPNLGNGFKWELKSGDRTIYLITSDTTLLLLLAATYLLPVTELIAAEGRSTGK